VQRGHLGRREAGDPSADDDDIPRLAERAWIHTRSHASTGLPDRLVRCTWLRLRGVLLPTGGDPKTPQKERDWRGIGADR
jgi:hypothetical protein